MKYLSSHVEDIYLEALFIWLLFIPVPIINGIFRENFLRFYLSPDIANLVSTLILSVLFFSYAYFILHKKLFRGLLSQSLVIGLMWVSLTVTFEFSLGLLVERQPIARLFEDYNILSGRIWSLFLLLMLFTPLIIKKIETAK